jgi:hypothetical protein
MSRVDQLVRRARRHLDGGEALLASAVGVEHEGRRRRVVLVTDRRVIVAWTRPSPPVVLPHSCRARHEHDRLILTSDDVDITLDAIDPQDARQVVALLSRRHGQPLSDRMGPAFHVRIIS